MATRLVTRRVYRVPFSGRENEAERLTMSATTGNVNATRTVRTPTSWTRPLQIAVIALALGQILYSVSYPYWSASVWNWWGNIVNAGGEQVHWWGWPLPPPGSPHDVLLALLDTFGVPLLTVAIAVAVIVAAIKRWSWAFLVIGVLLALYGLLRTYNLLVNVILFPALPPPPWGPVVMPDVGFEGVFGLAALALLLFVIVALATRGPWGMRKIA
jgi:hypothetical protein